MTFLSLFLAGLTGSLCLSTPVPTTNMIRSRSVLLILTLCPLFWATYIAITRIEDNVRRDPSTDRIVLHHSSLRSVTVDEML